MSTSTTIQQLRLYAKLDVFAYRKQDLINAANEMEQNQEELAQWRATFPGKSAADVALLLASAQNVTVPNVRAIILDAVKPCDCVHADPTTCARLRDNDGGLETDNDEAPRRECECDCHRDH